ncbi:hypothetical protein SAMN05445850_3813 [Paraburkholderia tuberum]|uniref:Phage integrase family protein n=1 Tax=Paraburkholderia tuberum TaxID=157910 RepID=A0A1H1IXM9_9BURK|nr:hypothetical protein SAMN05445850_3813 [Paraburkholderia tuberum]
MRQVKLVSGRRPHLPQRSRRGKRSASNAIPVPNLRHCGERESAAAHPGDYTVRQLCRDYLEGYVEVNRKTKGAVEVARIFKAMLGPIGICASQPSHAPRLSISSSRTGRRRRLRMDLGSAWHYALDAGRLPEQHQQEVDDADPRLEGRTEPLRDPVRRAAGAGLNLNPFTQNSGHPPRLPVTHWSAHDLRRATRTLLATLGCPNDIAEAVLGHVQPGIIGVYNRHTYHRERREWLTQLSHRLAAPAPPRSRCLFFVLSSCQDMAFGPSRAVQVVLTTLSGKRHTTTPRS